jgi:hypothetical protein
MFAVENLGEHYPSRLARPPMLLPDSGDRDADAYALTCRINGTLER